MAPERCHACLSLHVFRFCIASWVLQAQAHGEGKGGKAKGGGANGSAATASDRLGAVYKRLHEIDADGAPAKAAAILAGGLATNRHF